MRRNERKMLPEFPVPDKLMDPETLAAFEDIALNANKDSIKSDIYKGKSGTGGVVRFGVRERLAEIFFDKCAYCEDIEAKPEVEHYRPKAKVLEDKAHPGYYWLCYEWTNLLPSCRYCNTEGGKGNQFPVFGTRVSAPTIVDGVWDKSTIPASSAPLFNEQPYLLHPEVDHPDNGSFFKFNPDGSIEGIDELGRAQRTIEICNLKRENLLQRRLKLVQEPIIKSIRRMIKLYEQGILSIEDVPSALNLIFLEMQEKRMPNEPFSLFAIYLYDHFNEMIAPFVTIPEQRDIISMAFEKFKAEHPE